MNEPDWKGALGEAFEEAVAYLQGIPSRSIPSYVDLSTLRAALGGSLPERPMEPREVVADLAAAADQGVVASGSGRFFGFVIGGANPAALAADWLTSAWDQNAGLYVLGPAASVVEEVAGEWLAELFGLPAGVSVGFVTGGQMANFTGLAAGLHDVLHRVGWDLAAGGLWDAPRVRILAGAGRHGTIDRALRFLGVGTGAIVEVDADEQGRMRPAALAAALDQTTWASNRVRPGGQCQQWSDRPRCGNLRASAPTRGLGARGRRVRTLGSRQPATATACRRDGIGRFVGH